MSVLPESKNIKGKISFAFFICGVFFALGAAAGLYASASFVSGSGAVSEIAADFGFSEGQRGEALGLIRLFLADACFILLAFAGGLSVPGVVITPAISCVRGFFALFSLSLAVKTVGSAAFCARFLTLPLRLAVFLVAASASFSSSERLFQAALGRNEGEAVIGTEYFILIIVSLCALLFLSVLETIL